MDFFWGGKCANRAGENGVMFLFVVLFFVFENNCWFGFDMFI